MISIYNSIITDMKSIEIENENVQLHLSPTSEKQNEKILNTESKGEVIMEGENGILKFERRLFSSNRNRLEGDYRSKRATNELDGNN